MKYFGLFLILTLAGSTTVMGQQVLRTPVAETRSSSNMSVRLQELSDMDGRVSSGFVRKYLKDERIAFRRADQKVHVEIIDRGDSGGLQEILDGLDIDVAGVWRNQASCYVSLSQISDLSSSLPTGYFARVVHEESYNDEAPGVQNSQSYIDAGRDGSGIKVGIIDGGYALMDSVILDGDLPGTFDSIDYTGSGMLAGGSHGTACFEVAYDNAPGAEYFVYRISGSTQFGMAVNECIANDVDIITCSLGPHNTGWGDNTGPYCAAVIDALDDGMLFFATAGNEAEKHWQGTLSDNDDDNWHAWSGSDELNGITVQDSSSSNNTVTIWMQWDSDETEDHYDLYLYDAAGITQLDISNESDQFEVLSWANDSPFVVQAAIAVRAKTANPPEFELFIANQTLEFQVAESSIECPANVTSPNCISVGAVTHGDYTSAAGTTPITNYSSHGPTNGGNQAPDLCAVTLSTTNSVGAFSGTSCAAPNAAGAAAALWSSLPGYEASGIRQLLLRKAYLFKDWGDPGIDMIYGYGGLYLKDFTEQTLYIYRYSGNNGTQTLPYSSIEQADAIGPAGRSLFFLGHDHDVPGGGILIDKPMMYRSLVRTSDVD